MPAVISFLLTALALAACIYFVARADRARRAAPGAAGTSEYRTDLPVDVCMDYLAHKNVNDAFEYTCKRQADGSFLLHFTLHRPTRQPMDTLYQLRLDPGRQTVVTLTFLREAFGYQEPVFPEGMLDAFVCQKLDAHCTN